MGRHIEIEFKNMIGRENFTKLLQYFQIKEDDFFSQKNHYLDTPDISLGRKKSALRIRERDGSFEFTLKRTAKEGILEINQNISSKQAERILEEKSIPSGEVIEELIMMDIDPDSLEYKGVLMTRRAQVSFKNGQLMFDHSTYLGKEDFEIEYEVDEQHVFSGEKDFHQLLTELNIPLIKSDNKIKRFFDAKKEGSH